MIANLKPVHFTMDTNHFLSFGVLLFILNMIANTVSSKTSMLSLVKYDSYWCHMHAHVHACDMWCNGEEGGGEGREKGGEQGGGEGREKGGEQGGGEGREKGGEQGRGEGREKGGEQGGGEGREKGGEGREKEGEQGRGEGREKGDTTV